jgi:hypothetical protein
MRGRRKSGAGVHFGRRIWGYTHTWESQVGFGLAFGLAFGHLVAFGYHFFENFFFWIYTTPRTIYIALLGKTTSMIWHLFVHVYYSKALNACISTLGLVAKYTNLRTH